MINRVVYPVFGVIAGLAFGTWLALESDSRMKERQPSGRKADAGLDNDWFMTQRSYPSETIPRGAFQKMQRAMRSATLKSTVGGLAQEESWTLAGPTNIGGRITSLAIHPSIADIIYAGSASGGVWKTTNFGQTWTSIFNEAFSIGSLALDPFDPSVIYVGTGEANPAGVATYPGNGIWRSSNAGLTWSHLGLEETGYIGKVIVDPADQDRLFAVALGLYRDRTQERGVYRSTNRGADWERVLFVNDTTGATDLLIDPTNPSRLVAAMWTRYRSPRRSILSGPSTGLFRSTDGGTTWTPVTNGFPSNDPTLGRVSLAFAPSSPEIIYALAAQGIAWRGVYKSTDFGSSWQFSYSAASSWEYQVWFNNVIAVHPTDPSLVWAGMTGIYKSTDGGITFPPAPYTGESHVDYHAIAYSPSHPGTIVLGNDGGVFTSTDGGFQWVKSYNLPITQFYAGSIAPHNARYLLGGTQDNGSLRTQTGIPNSWTRFYGGDGFFCFVDPVDSNIIYAESQFGGLAYSTNGGASFNNGTVGIVGSDRKNWQTPLAQDQQSPNILYTGTHRVYRSSNRMVSWAPISGDLTYGDGGRVGTVSTIDVAPTSSSVVYIGTDDGRVWVTVDGGSSWQEISAGLPRRWVTRVTVDPHTPSTAYVTLSGFIENDYQSHVYRTTNYGATWSSIGGSLPDLPVNDVLVDPLSPNHIYLATDLNVMRTTNLGGAWTVFGLGLPEVSVHEIAIHSLSRTLAAFTHGRSVYTIPVPTSPTVTFSVSPNPGWNIISTPFHGGNDSVRALFPEALTNGFYYDQSIGYGQSQTLDPRVGYWVRFPAAPSKVILHGPPSERDSVILTQGWNLIGSFTSQSVPVSMLNADPPDMRLSNFFGYDGAYIRSSEIRAGQGYWVRADRPGKLVYDGSSSLISRGETSLRIELTDDAPPLPPSFHEVERVIVRVPDEYVLSQNYPNPFNPRTTIYYGLPVRSRVSLRVFDAVGQLVGTLVDDEQEAGFRSVQWDAGELAGGIYFCHLSTKSLDGPNRSSVQTRKLLLVR